MKAGLKFIFVGALLIFESTYASISYISYAGGKQTGSFKLNGDEQPYSYFDTVIIDSSVLITNYDAAKSFTQCYGVPKGQLGFYFGLTNGMLGKSTSTDTIWNNARAFPNSLFPLDSIPEPGYSLYKQFGNNPKGLNVDSIYSGGVCTINHYSFISGYNNIVYFQFNNGLSSYYGKLMIYGYEYSTEAEIDGEPIISYDFAYTISNSTDLDTGPVSITPFKQSPHQFPLDNQYYDPRGRHIPESAIPKRDFLSIPVLFSKP
jgi:hypothetical protein